MDFPSGEGVQGHGVDAVEDAGYFCIDNIPPKLLVTFAQLLESSSQHYSKVAVVCDIRSGRGFESYACGTRSGGYCND